MNNYIVTRLDQYGSSPETKVKADDFLVGEYGELVFLEQTVCDDCGGDIEPIAIFAKGHWSFVIKETV